jgi:hypothetical protein
MLDLWCSAPRGANDEVVRLLATPVRLPGLPHRTERVQRWQGKGGHGEVPWIQE